MSENNVSNHYSKCFYLIPKKVLELYPSPKIYQLGPQNYYYYSLFSDSNKWSRYNVKGRVVNELSSLLLSFELVYGLQLNCETQDHQNYLRLSIH